MILVYICPECREMQIGSRRKEMACISCGHPMELTELTFLEWTEMSKEERTAYSAQWRMKKGTGQ